jgi:predicted transcriptional regulator
MVTKIKKEKFIRACIGSGGIQSVVAQNLGVDRSTVTYYLERNPEMREHLLTAEDAIIDLAENKLQNKINSGDMKALKFFLETKGKKRGYVRRVEQEHSGIEPVQFTVITQAIQEDTDATSSTDTNPETKSGDEVSPGQEDN